MLFRTFLSNGFTRVDYPRCPDCPYPLIECKRYTRLIKKIQSKFAHITYSTINSRDTAASAFLSIINLSPLTECTEIPANIRNLMKKSLDRTRQKGRSTLFMHMLDLFRKLDSDVSNERNVVLNSIYEEAEKNDSIFLTRQQWSDLEKEYNRLSTIACVRKIQKLTESHSKDFDGVLLNDILFETKSFTQQECDTCNILLNENNGKQHEWKSILPDNTDFDDIDRERLICDEKMYLCPEGRIIEQ